MKVWPGGVIGRCGQEVWPEGVAGVGWGGAEYRAFVSSQSWVDSEDFTDTL